MTGRRRLVRVPASSANLGPGYDVLAAALTLHLELEVDRERTPSRSTPGASGFPPTARTSACGPSSALHPRGRPALRDPQRDPARPRPRLQRGGDRRRADGRRPPVRARARPPRRLRATPSSWRATRTTSPRRSTAASSSARPTSDATRRRPRCARPARASGGRRGRARRSRGGGPDRGGARSAARRTCPSTTRSPTSPRPPSSSSGIERSDLTLIARGLADRLHQPRRAPTSTRARWSCCRWPTELGAIGATVSGAGPAVLFWCFWQDTGKVVDALRQRAGDGVEIRRARFTPLGADVPEL